MVAEKVAEELQSALKTLYAERAELDRNIKLLEDMLAKFGAKPRRGPGRPRGSTNKARRGPGRPPGSGKKTTKKKVKKNWTPAARKAAADRMKKIWAERKKKSGKKKTTSKTRAKK